jgi:DNA invertase Pin-like site-specific DNA recombinase
MKAIGYIRVSTQDQVDSGLGLDNQRSKILAFCNAKGWELEDIIEENGISGSVPIEERKEGRRLLELIADKKNEIRAVVMLRLDRGFRNTEDCLKTTREWTRKGIGVHFIDMAGMDPATSMGVLQMTMMAGFSQFERSIIGDRTRAALAVKRGRGEKTGGHVPYGYSWEMNKDGVKILKPWKI